MQRVALSGNHPGWIHDHRADPQGEHEIRVTGGTILVLDGEEVGDRRNEDTYVLDVRTGAWRVQPGS